jgi:putative peptide zinc metalloprotease protein
LAGRQVSDIEAHIRQVFTWTGATVFLVAIAGVKVLHEFGHAYQAVSRGLRVQVMGVAFFALLPLFYSDITDAWRLRRRADRIMVDLGGLLVELTIAVYATALWCFLPDGPARTVTFAIATSSWVLSLLVNLNPFMRFDGYYLLADSLGIHNLQHRAFAMGRWAMRRALFGLDDPVPEKFDAPTHNVLIAYAYGAWVYRLFLYLAISLFVYSIFFKLAGIFLLLASVGALVVKPVLLEVRYWIDASDRITVSRRSLVTLGVVLIALAAFFWPMSTRIYVPAVLEEARQQSLFAPQAARLEAVFVVEGQSVARGDPLFHFYDPELPARIAQSQTRIAMHNARLLTAAGDAIERAERIVIARILEEEKENLSALLEQQDSLTVIAPMDGQVREISTDIDPGTWYRRAHFLGLIIQPGSLAVRGFISEVDLERLDPTKGANFIADEPSIPALRLDHLEVSDYAVDRLPDGYLARPYGGSIAVASSEPRELLVAGVLYPVLGTPQSEGNGGRMVEDRVQRGVIVMRSVPQSFAYRIGKRLAQVVVRELGF